MIGDDTMIAMDARDTHRTTSTSPRARDPRRDPSETDPTGPLLRVTVALAVVAALGALAAPAAHGQVSLGAHGSFASQHQTYGMGPRLSVDIAGAEGLSVNASLDVYFPEEGGLWGLNASVDYSLFPESAVSPYVGAGASYLNDSEEEVVRDIPGGGVIYVGGEKSMTGLDLLGGLEFWPAGAVTPFAQARYTTTGAGQFVLSGGVLLF